MGSGDGLVVLVLEDDPIIAFDLEYLLLDLGCRPTVVQDNAQAAAFLADRNPDRAILDFKLARDTSLATAVDLAARGIPVAFVTGYGDHVPLPPELRDAAVFNKPVNREALGDWIAGLGG
jgi:DNA-binding NtrC family response regulator